MARRSVEARMERLATFYDDIENGRGLFDRVEQFCRERQIGSYPEFMKAVRKDDRTLFRLAYRAMARGGRAAYGLRYRIKKVAKEIERAGASV